MRQKITSVLLGLMVAGFPAAAAEIRVRLQPESTTIDFTLKATMHTVHGTAALDRADFTIDTITGAASGEAVVVSGTADTGNKKRDKKMHSKVLVSGEHPMIVLHATSFEGTLLLAGRSEITLVGVMNLLGEDHPIRVPMTVEITDDTATVDAQFLVPYVEWGLDDPSTFVLRVGKEVPVTIESKNATVSITAEP